MGDQTAQFTEEYCAEKMKIIALIIALAASSEISGDSNERVVPEESLVSEAWFTTPGQHTHGGGTHTVTGHHFMPTLALPKKGAIKKMFKKHIKKLKRRANKHFKRHFRRSRRSSRRSRRSSRRSRRSSRRGRRSIRQRGTKWECSWNHNPWFPCTPRPGDVVVPPYNGYWTKRHRKRSMKRRRL